jgi:hypothetical protein
MQNLHERHEKVVSRAFQKKLSVTKRAQELRVAHEQKQKKLSQYGGYGYDYQYNTYDAYGNEIADEVEQGGDFNDDGGSEMIVPDDYYENMLYGVIDGMTSSFDQNCSSSLYGVVDGGFRANEFKAIYNPTNSVKFQMSVNKFTESTNSVYTFCDFAAFFSNFAMYTDYENPEQYIQIASRISGSLIS